MRQLIKTEEVSKTISDDIIRNTGKVTDIYENGKIVRQIEEGEDNEIGKYARLQVYTYNAKQQMVKEESFFLNPETKEVTETLGYIDFEIEDTNDGGYVAVFHHGKDGEEGYEYQYDKSGELISKYEACREEFYDGDLEADYYSKNLDESKLKIGDWMINEKVYCSKLGLMTDRILPHENTSYHYEYADCGYYKGNIIEYKTSLNQEEVNITYSLTEAMLKDKPANVIAHKQQDFFDNLNEKNDPDLYFVKKKFVGEFEKDSNGHIIKVEFFNKRYEFEYDAEGNLTKKTSSDVQDDGSKTLKVKEFFYE